MSAWKIAALRDVATIERSSIQPEQIESGTYYVGLEHIESGGALLDPKPVDAGVLASSKFQFTERHLLYGKLRPYLAKIACPEFAGICSTDILPILAGSRIERRFLLHFLRRPAMVDYANSRAVGINLPRLSPSVLAEFEIPVPSLSEQRRIAEVLDRAEALRAKRRVTIAKLDTLAHAIFLHLFGDPVTNPKGWKLKSLSDIAEFENGDRSSNYPSGDEIKEHGVLFLSSKNIVDSALDLTGAVFITEEKFKSLSRGKAKRNDLVITLRGTLGNCCIFDSDHETAFINAQMMIIRPKAEGAHRYIHALLTSKQSKERFLRIGYGAAVQQLSTAQLSELQIPDPPPALQHQLARRLSAVEKLKTAQRASLAEMDALFAALQHRAFRGEL